ncbi:lytic transglycosylase [Phaeodactylibacter luteus]|uniref:LysM peptidoglycan-binding domain-containing protein n=1 Tax=Phaeodactylibacter luteus TaxID=1564516 RepID=A0A5C6RWU4_9BACT|nr:LysM peptidoglycan-binding domain-containing protein [Phaeodactylibacter luteus]TXB66554.1 LysM peptidoglycan-binding domain-containing protein [Phaeodactylibacter luteus]
MNLHLPTLFLLAALSLSAPALGANAATLTGDSLQYLTAKDTVLLSMGQLQQPLMTHYLAPGQTLYSLARFYGLSVNELYFFNPGLSPQSMYYGMPVYIPLPPKAIRKYWMQDMRPGEYAPAYYMVRKGDTLYRIAKSYFNIPLEEMMARNGLLDHNLKPNQLLLIGWLSVEGVPDSLRKHVGGVLGERNAALQKLFIYQANQERIRESQGAAFWPKDLNMAADLLALHRTAKIGSVVSIHNPMSRRTVYAKVVGRIPDTAYKDDIVVVVSPQVAQLLGAIDPRFFVKVKYHR